MKYTAALAALLLGLCAERGSAQVLLYNVVGVPTTGSITFDDTLSGGATTTNLSPVIILLDQPMNNLGWMTYTSTGFPHVDTASMTVDITQALFPAGPLSIPWFAATASLVQTGSNTGDTAVLTGVVSAGFEGFMATSNPSSLLALLGYNVSGSVGTNPGAFASLNAQLDYYDSTGVPFLVGSLFWNYSNVTPGAFATTVFPTWVGAPTLGANLIDVNGFITLQADPSSISISPVPEPTTFASLFLGAAMLAGRRRRTK